MKKTRPGCFGTIATLKGTPERVDFLSLHTHTEIDLPPTCLEAMNPSRIRILAMAIASLAFPFGSFAGEPTVLIDESFEAETLPEKWQAGGRPNSFMIIEGALRGIAQPDDSHGPSIGVPLAGQNLSVEFDVKLVSPRSYFLFLIDGDSQFKGQAHLLRFSASGKAVALMQDRGDPASKLAQKKERDANGGKRIQPTPEQLADPAFYRIEPLARQAADPSDGAWHHVRIELRGNVVSARFDEGPELSATGTVLDVPKSRIVFLVGQNGDVRIDNVKVTNVAK